jgi:hypothetical protein
LLPAAASAAQAKARTVISVGVEPAIVTVSPRVLLFFAATAVWPTGDPEKSDQDPV